MKKLIVIAIALLFVFALVAASPKTEVQAEFIVGAILPLSGRSADYGVAAKNGIELAREENPELFSNIRFLYEDSLYDGKTTITTFNKMKSIDKANLVFVWGHGPAEAVSTSCRV